MNSTRSTNRFRGTRFFRSGLPLITLAACLALVSAATCFGKFASQPALGALPKKVVGRGHLTGTRELHQVVTFRTSYGAHLAIETVGSRPRVLWQAEGGNSASVVDSIRVDDLDGDGIAEIMSLWWNNSSPGAALRVIHWDRQAKSFVEIGSSDKDGSLGLVGVNAYKISQVNGRKRILTFLGSKSAQIRGVPNAQFELKGNQLMRLGGGTISPRGESGIEGQALISPVHPGPTRQGQSDTAPFQTTLVISRTSDGAEVSRVETGSDGRFRVALPPGTYKVGPPAATGRRLPRGGEETVTVAPGKFAHVTINFDSGMR